MNERTTCCIAGGGPAGVMLGFLLARAGVEVTVLEKHQDFLRDFRGDTIHPSTLEVMYELGLLEDLLRLPHEELHGIEAHFGERVLHLADLSHLPTHCKFIAFMPQWDFLNFLARDRKSTRLNSCHVKISYAVFCLKKKKTIQKTPIITKKNLSRRGERKLKL